MISIIQLACLLVAFFIGIICLSNMIIKSIEAITGNLSLLNVITSAVIAVLVITFIFDSFNIFNFGYYHLTNIFM